MQSKNVKVGSFYTLSSGEIVRVVALNAGVASVFAKDDQESTELPVRHLRLLVSDPTLAEEVSGWMRALELRVNNGATPLRKALGLAFNRGCARELGEPTSVAAAAPITCAELSAELNALETSISSGQITLNAGLDSAYNRGVERPLG